MVNRRAAVRYQSFDALEGYKDEIKYNDYCKQKIEKPELSEDDYERINFNLKYAMDYNQNIKFRYYKDGFIKEIVGSILKVDILNKSIKLSDGKILLLRNIVDVILC